MQNKKGRVAFIATLFAAGLPGALLTASSSAIARESTEERVDAPDQTGRYSIGHTTVVITDTSRNPDGSTPSTTAGRPLYLHIWYPTPVQTSQRVRYTWNKPIYNQNFSGAVYPGLPDVPALSFTGSSSAHSIAEGATLAKGKFPYGAIYEQYYLGTDASCHNDDDEDWAPSVSER